MSQFLLNSIPVLAAALMAIVAVRWAYYKILHIAKDKGLVDNKKTILDCAQYHYGFNELAKQLELVEI